MGRYITYIGSPCSAMRRAQQEQNGQNSVYIPKVGDILVRNTITGEDKIVPHEEWLQLEDSWDIQGIYGVTTYEEENAEDGYYVIMSNGTTLIIAPEDFNKVSNNWEQVDTIVVTDPYNGHAYVDLGLPSGTKWATMNVGATSETEYGNYYQYGKGADDYAVTSGQSDYSGTENPLALSADTAAQVWGGQWHMPTSAQCAELTANTTYEWTTINGVNGGKFTAQNGNYIFIPAVGYYHSVFETDETRLWCSTPETENSSRAYFLYFNEWDYGVSDNPRYFGETVRPVIG